MKNLHWRIGRDQKRAVDDRIAAGKMCRKLLVPDIRGDEFQLCGRDARWRPVDADDRFNIVKAEKTLNNQRPQLTGTTCDRNPAHAPHCIAEYEASNLRKSSNFAITVAGCPTISNYSVDVQ